MGFDSASLDKQFLLAGPKPESLDADIKRAARESFGKEATKKNMAIHFAVPKKAISAEDENAFYSFSIRAGEFYLRAKIFGSRSLEHGREIKSKWQARSELRAYVRSGMAYHDLSHIIWKIISTKGATYAPSFLTETAQPLNETLLREEIAAGLFTNVYPGGRPKTINTLVMLMSSHETEKLLTILHRNIYILRSQKSGYSLSPALDAEYIRAWESDAAALSSINHDSFESIFEVFQILHTNGVRMEMLSKGYVPRKEWETFNEKHEMLAAAVIAKPDPLLRALALRIYSDYKKNSRIVLDIFLEDCGTLGATNTAIAA